VRGALDESTPSTTVRVLPDGAKYVGDWLNGLPHGSGSLTYASGERFEGIVSNGLPDYARPCTVARTSGDGYYVGEMLHGKRHGYGILTQKGADTCEGTWSGDMPLDCSGTITIDGQRYTGARSRCAERAARDRIPARAVRVGAGPWLTRAPLCCARPPSA
jgi:hypothetical protein